MKTLKQPIDAVLAVTYNCNARCVMCNIWQDKPRLENQLGAKAYANLPLSLKYINVSGGEPFLRDDLPEIIRVLKKRCPKSRIIISTNGFLPERIYAMMQEIQHIDPGVGVGLSLDGIGYMHEQTRGIEGAYDKVMQSLEKLKTLGIKNIRFGFTAAKENISHFYRVYELANNLGVQFSCAVAQDSSHYFKTQNNITVDKNILKKELAYIVENEIKSFSPKKWARAFFAQGLSDFAHGNGRPLSCRAGEDFFFINPYGDIYPCNVLDKVMGNIKNFNFAALWGSKKAEQIRGIVQQCQARCWMICTARTAIKEHPLRTGWWILNQKTRSHLGFPRENCGVQRDT